MSNLISHQGSHGALQYTVYGGDIHFVEINLPPEEAVVAESGSMMYMEQGVQMQGMMGDGSRRNSGLLGSLIGLGKRKIMGESTFLARFTNKGSMPHNVAFAAAYHGTIIPVRLAECGGSVLCQKSSFLCATLGTEINIGFTKRITAGLFGGEGLILQRLDGDGVAFIHAGGTVKERKLEAGETLYVDTGSLVAFEKSVTFDVKAILGLRNLMFSGEDLFLTQVTGPGKVWMQSLPYGRSIVHLRETLAGMKSRGRR